MDTELKIDSEFEKIIPPLTDEEFQQLEANILSDKEIFTPITVWNGTIIDGHNRYKIIRNHPEIPFRTRDIHFENRYEAIAWICNNQLGRRNLSDIQWTILLGRRYEAEKKSHGAKGEFRGNQYGEVVSHQNDDLPKSTLRTAKQIADNLGIGQATVERAGKFVQALDIAEDISPGIQDDIISRAITPKKQDVIAIARASPEDRRQMVEDLRKPKPKPESKDTTGVETPLSPNDNDKHQVSVDNFFDTFNAAVDTMIATCKMITKQCPALLNDGTYRLKIIEAMQKTKKYIIEIEGEENSGHNENN